MKKLIIIGALLGVAVINSNADQTLTLPDSIALQAAQQVARQKINVANLENLQGSFTWLSGFGTNQVLLARSDANTYVRGITNASDVLSAVSSLPFPTNQVSQFQLPFTPAP